MFIGIVIGVVFGVVLGLFVGSSLAGLPKFVESTAIGFGIGLAFIAFGAGLNAVVRFGDKQSQKIKGGT